MPNLLIANGRVVDPSQGLDRVTNVLIENGCIAALDVGAMEGVPTVNAAGMCVLPGLVDTNTQLREPGFEEDETIESGAKAALAGGYTSIACIPETDPPIDTEAGVQFIQQRAAKLKLANVFVLACVSKNREGTQLAEIGSLVSAGAVGFSDATRPIHNAELLRRALEYCRMFDKPILNHPEVLELSRGGVMHEGRTSLVLGLSGMPLEAEDVMTSRDIRLCESTNGRLHLLNVSSSHSIDLVRRAKSRNARISAGVAISNLCFADETLRSFNPNYKVNPPLRSHDHIEQCIAGLVDGTIDVICSGHAPRASEKKIKELDQSPFGVTSLELVLSMAHTWLVCPGKMDWLTLVSKLSTNPAKILTIDRGTLKVGAAADVTIFDPNEAWIVAPHEFASKSTNSPLLGEELKGRVVRTIVAGETRFSR